MYQDSWGLRESPFANTLDPRAFFASATHEEGLARLHFLVESRRRLGLLLGPSGCGKSLLLATAAEHFRRTGLHVTQLACYGRDAHEFLWSLAVGLGLNPAMSAPLHELWLTIGDRLIEHRYQQRGDVILCDDADQAGIDVLAQIERLVQTLPAPAARLTVVLASPESRMFTVGRRLLELVDLRIDVRPWDLEDTERYVHQALVGVGGRADVFSAEALARLHDLSLGIPRRVNQLADLALLAASGEGLRQVDAHTISGVYDELGVLDVASTLP